MNEDKIDVEIDEEFYKGLMENVFSEIKNQYDSDVIKFVKDKLDKYIVGEDRNKILLWLIMVSKDLSEPLHASVEGISSIGKTTLVSRTAKAMPENSIETLSRVSTAFLDYIKDKLQHRILWIQQLGGIQTAQDSLHVLMTEKGLKLGTVKREKGGIWESYYVEAKGPICFITTTTSTQLDEQFRTRVWRLFCDDSPEQTKQVQEFNSLLSKKPWIKDEIESEIKKVALYVEHLNKYGVKDILIPYSDKIILDGKSVRLRRDHLRLLELIKVIAYVNQFFNHYIVKINGKEYVIANKRDLEMALEITQESLKRVIRDLSKGEEHILNICRELTEEGDVITSRNVAKYSKGKYSQETARKYLNNLVDRGYLYLINEGAKGRGNQNIYELSEKEIIPSLIDVDKVEEITDIKEYIEKEYQIAMNNDLILWYISPFIRKNLNQEEITLFPEKITLDEKTIYLLSHFSVFELPEEIARNSQNNRSKTGSGFLEVFKKSQKNGIPFYIKRNGQNNRGERINGKRKNGIKDKQGRANLYIQYKLLIEADKVLNLEDILFLMDNHPDLYKEYCERMG